MPPTSKHPKIKAITQFWSLIIALILRFSPKKASCRVGKSCSDFIIYIYTILKTPLLFQRAPVGKPPLLVGKPVKKNRPVVLSSDTD